MYASESTTRNRANRIFDHTHTHTLAGTITILGTAEVRAHARHSHIERVNQIYIVSILIVYMLRVYDTG